MGASQSLVGMERAESINACGAPSGAVKHEVSNPSKKFFAYSKIRECLT